MNSKANNLTIRVKKGVLELKSKFSGRSSFLIVYFCVIVINKVEFKTTFILHTYPLEHL